MDGSKDSKNENNDEAIQRVFNNITISLNNSSIYLEETLSNKDDNQIKTQDLKNT